MTFNDDAALAQFRASLDMAYGGQIERVVLFGSRARGDAHLDSDYDIVVFLKGLVSFDQAAKALAEIETDILMGTGAVINAMPMPAEAYEARTGLMQELRRDGLGL